VRIGALQGYHQPQGLNWLIPKQVVDIHHSFGSQVVCNLLIP
jgi:hypothetical protein